MSTFSSNSIIISTHRVHHAKPYSRCVLSRRTGIYLDSEGTSSMNKKNLILSIEKAMKDMKDNE